LILRVLFVERRTDGNSIWITMIIGLWLATRLRQNYC